MGGFLYCKRELFFRGEDKSVSELPRNAAAGGERGDAPGARSLNFPGWPLPFWKGRGWPWPRCDLVFNEKLNNSWGKRRISHREALTTRIGMGENRFSIENPSILAESGFIRTHLWGRMNCVAQTVPAWGSGSGHTPPRWGGSTTPLTSEEVKSRESHRRRTRSGHQILRGLCVGGWEPGAGFSPYACGHRQPPGLSLRGCAIRFSNRS